MSIAKEKSVDYNTQILRSTTQQKSRALGADLTTPVFRLCYDWE